MTTKEFTSGRLHGEIFDTSVSMGEAAASGIRDDILSLLKEKDHIAMMFAAAPSQNTTLSSLLDYRDIPWNRIDAFHMDEYVGLKASDPASFRYYLAAHCFGYHAFRSINMIRGEENDPEGEAKRYGALLDAAPMDIILLGIGENGHIAFNEPNAETAGESAPAKVISLTRTSRLQQVHDGCFPSLDAVPELAVTVTLPVFRRAGILHCVVPGTRKAEAVRKTVSGPVGPACPASLLKAHAHATLYLDAESAALL